MIELVLDGAKSGKSAYAELQAIESGKQVIYIATAEAVDSEMQARINHHRQNRPHYWQTFEEPLALAKTIKGNGGEMGIANTTSACAIATSLIGGEVEQLTGLGTGLAFEEIQHKVKVIQNAIALHKKFLTTPLKVLQYSGGFEIAALVGAYIYAAQQSLPILIDGFIASVAALLAVKIKTESNTWFIFAHRSQEKGHQLVLENLQARPLLDLKMRLGGAAAAVPLLQIACKLHNEMATFEQAKITTTI